jgi:MFS family permease
MLLKAISEKIRQLHIRRWIIAYFSIAVLASLLAAIFFRDQQYSVDQAAVIIAIPILLAIVLGQLFDWLIVEKEPSQEEKEEIGKRQEEMKHTGKKLPNRLGIPVALLFLFGLLSFFVAVILSISAGLYLLFGLNIISKTVWLKICIPSFIAAVCFLGTFILAVLGIIFWPYRGEAGKIISNGFAQFRGDDKKGNGLRLNGIRIPSLPRFLL